jgi:hypothetical protein
MMRHNLVSSYIKLLVSQANLVEHKGRANLTSGVIYTVMAWGLSQVGQEVTGITVIAKSKKKTKRNNNWSREKALLGGSVCSSTKNFALRK